jgi:hypothetical protein
MNESQEGREVDPRERSWFYIWIAAGEVFGVFGLLQWVVLSPGSTAFEIAKGIWIAAAIVGVWAIFRWAKLREG